MKESVYLFTIGGFFLFTFGACQKTSKDELLIFLRNLEKNVNEEKLQKFRFAEIDSAGTTAQLVYNEVRSAYLEINPKSKLGIHLDSIGGNDTSVNVTYLLIAFHFYLNNTYFDQNIIKPVYFRMLEYEFAKEYNQFQKRKIGVAQINNTQLQIGDSIHVYLPIRDEFGRRSVIYPDSVGEDFNGMDSLRLSGIILEKKFGEKYPEGIDSTDLIFQLRVLNLSKKNVLISGKNIKKGDTMNFHVTWYGRMIDHY